MEPARQNGRNGLNGKNSNPYEMKPQTRTNRSRLCSRMSDGFMSDTIGEQAFVYIPMFKVIDC